MAAARLSRTTGDGSARDQHVVERDDLPPVGFSTLAASACTAAMAACSVYAPKRRDCSARSISDCAFGDLLAIPARAVLIFEQHQFAGRSGARFAPRFVQQHQRQQTERLCIVQQLDNESTKAQRLRGQIAAREFGAVGGAVAFVEDQIQHVQHALEPLGQFGERRHDVRQRVVADLRFRPARCVARSSASARDRRARSAPWSVRRLRATSARCARPA